MTSSFKTFLKHTAKDFHNQSVNPPVVRASTIIFKSMQDIRKTQSKFRKNPIGGHFDYGRQGTSTTHILQQMLRKLEVKKPGIGSFVFSFAHKFSFVYGVFSAIIAVALGVFASLVFRKR